jgi:hypothetical protein
MKAEGKMEAFRWNILLILLQDGLGGHDKGENATALRPKSSSSRRIEYTLVQISPCPGRTDLE